MNLDSMIGIKCTRCRQYEKIKYCFSEARYQLISMANAPGNDLDEATLRDIKFIINQQFTRIIDAQHKHMEAEHVG